MNMTEALRAVAGAFFGTFGFLCLTRAPRKAWVPAGIIAALAYLADWLLVQAHVSEPLAVLFSTFLGSLLCHLLARKMRMINTVFLMAAIVPVVPGLGLYRMMADLGLGQTAAGAERGVDAMIIIAMTAVGLAMGSFTDRVVHRKTNPSSGPSKT